AVADKLELPQELNRVHNTFHLSNLKKYYADKPLSVSLDGEFQATLRYSLLEFTWEHEDQFQKNYPRLFTKTALSSSAAS
nr:hypothetical protein [Tanacetum cinerariifolium]